MALNYNPSNYNPSSYNASVGASSGGGVGVALANSGGNSGVVATTTTNASGLGLNISGSSSGNIGNSSSSSNGPHRKRTLLYSPHHPQQFIIATVGGDLRLCQWTPDAVSVLSVNADLQNVKCFDWSHDPATPELIAVGLTTGGVVLNEMGKGVGMDGRTDSEFRREFLPKQQRGCNVVCFNPVNHTQLLAGMEKVRSEPCVMIWDIRPSNPNASDNARLKKQKPFLSDPIRVYGGSGETACSASWIRQSPSQFVVGVGGKNSLLRCYDMRTESSTAVCSSPTTKAVHGVRDNPFNENQFLSFSEEGTIHVWDIRKPFVQELLKKNPLLDTNGVTECAWSPVVPGLIGSLSGSDGFVRLWQLRDESSSGNGMQWTSSITKHSRSVLSSFSWHPTLRNNIIAVSKNGRVEIMKIYQPSKTTWSSSGELAFSSNQTVTGYAVAPTKNSHGRLTYDVSITMRERVKAGYANDINKNIDICSDDGKLAELWQYMSRCEALSSNDDFKRLKPTLGSFPGVYYIITEAPLGSKLESDMGDALPYRAYTSLARKLALGVCGWPMEKSPGDIERLLFVLENAKQFERSAAIALFHLGIGRAVTALRNSNNESIKLLAIGLAGYTEGTAPRAGGNGGGNSLWMEMVGKLMEDLTHPYLRAIFHFLTTTNIYKILEDPGILLCDRVGLACRFLDDSRLVAYIQGITRKAVELGDLDGAILTGFSKEIVELFEAYVDKTSDVQTTALALSHVYPKQLDDSRINVWIESYRTLLDFWQCYHYRCQMDIWRRKLNEEQKLPPNILARCNFCQQPLSTSSSRQPRLPNRGATPQSKATVCPNANCRKPLPRCALCTLHLGTLAQSVWSYGLQKSKLSSSSSQLPLQRTTSAGSATSAGEAKMDPSDEGIGYWFSWCQSCRHGGHVVHMAEWFEKNSICPVAGCSCHCRERDVLPVPTAESSELATAGIARIQRDAGSSTGSTVTTGSESDAERYTNFFQVVSYS